MNKLDAILKPNELSPRDLATVEAKRLLEALTDGNGDEIKDRWYELGKHIRTALAEIRQTEARAAGPLAHTAQNEYLGI